MIDECMELINISYSLSQLGLLVALMPNRETVSCPNWEIPSFPGQSRETHSTDRIVP